MHGALPSKTAGSARNMGGTGPIVNSDGQAELASIASARARIGGWPIPTTAMSPTSRDLHFDVREGSHGVELIVPACDHHAVTVPWVVEAIHLRNAQVVPRSFLPGRRSYCRPCRQFSSARGAIPPILRIGIDPEQLRSGSRLDSSLRDEDDQTGTRQKFPLDN